MKRVLWVLFGVSVLMSTVLAQSAPSPRKNLTLAAATQVALEHNISVVQAQVALEQQQGNVQAAYGNLLPSVNMNGNWTRAQKATDVTIIQGNTFPGQTSTQNYFSTGVNANLTLFNGFANTSGVTRASSAAVSAEYGLYRTRQTTVFQVQSLYLNVLRNEQLMRVNEDNLKRDRRQLDQIVESNRVGAKALADVYRQQVQVGNDELALIGAQNNFEKAKADLVFFLGLGLSDEYDFRDASIPSEIDSATVSTSSQGVDFATLYHRARDLRPDLKSQLESVRSADAGVTVAQSGHYPSVTFGGGYSLNSTEFNTIQQNHTMSWGLSLQLPLFSGFQVSNQVQQAQLGLRNQQELLSQSERQIQVDIKKAILDLEAARKQLDVAMKTVKSAQEDFRMAQERYNLGAGTILDLLTATANFTSAVSNKVNSVYQYLNAKAQLEYAQGSTPQ